MDWFDFILTYPVFDLYVALFTREGGNSDSSNLLAVYVRWRHAYTIGLHLKLGQYSPNIHAFPGHVYSKYRPAIKELKQIMEMH